ncbi:MAG: AAA family ATPase [Puia sp.]|nr:AAA family ATPase [Puia sp.]
MKILAIRIRNLASLSGDTVIDFTAEPLVSAGIFAITGPTGSGKSTILDALCLALYGKTPRYRLAEGGVDVQDVGGNTIKQDDARGILRDGSAEGYAEVDFVGTNGVNYRVKWNVRRARGRAEGALQQVEIVLTNITTGGIVPGRRTELQATIEQLVGLNFEQFTRSVLLAQGDFTAFLKANKDEKASLLEKLTGTQVYSEISRRTFERHREENQSLRDLEIRQGEIRTLTTEEVEELGLERDGLRDRVQREQQAVTTLSDGISWYEQQHSLQNGRDTAYEEHQRAVEGRQEAETRVRQLERVERVQAVKPEVEKQTTLRQELSVKRELLEKQEGSLEGLRERQETVDRKVQGAEEDLAKRSEGQEVAQPELERARALDAGLEEKSRQLRQAEEELQAVIRKEGELKVTLETKRKEAADVGGEIVRLSEWKTQNAGRQAVSENESLILAKLSEATTLLEKLHAMQDALRQIQQDKERLERERTGLTGELEAKTRTLQKARDELEKNQAALNAESLDSLEKDKMAVDTILVELSDALSLWERFYSVQQEMERKSVKLGELELALDAGGKELANAERELEKAGLQEDVARKSLQKMQLAASGDVEAMRVQLIEDEPCPVCGSTNHPYVAEDPQFDQALAAQLEMVREYEQAHDKWQKEQGRRQEALRKLTEEVGVLKKDQVEQELALKAGEKNWTTCPVYDEAEKMPASERAEWINRRRQAEREKQVRLQKELEAARELQHQAEKNRIDRDRLEKERLEIQDRLKDRMRSLESVGERQQQHDKDLREAVEGLMGIEAQLKRYFFREEWFAGWKADAKGVERGIKESIIEWKTNIEALEKYRVEQKTLAVTIGSHESQLGEMEIDRKQREDNRDRLGQEYGVLKGQREELFAGRAVTEVERELKSAVDAARKVLEARRIDKEETGKAVIRALTEKEQNELAIKILLETLVAVEGQVRKWLSEYNREQGEDLSVEGLEKLLEVTLAWRRTEQASLRELDDKMIQAGAVLKERDQAVADHERHGRPEQAMEELVRLLAETRAGLEETIKRMNEVDFHLEDDRLNKEKMGELMQEMEVQRQLVENWAKLNEVIGSADGKKFRQVAQEYTLDVLIRFSNVQLSMLSTRYILQRVPGTLGLQVIDQDMGNEVRTVFSLSGGESFLVSLALALGLAALTSSRMRVESLFIDEGFGSLDSNTLNIAMDALERLHQQGRKVGVISHVQEMTERIGVQIQVKKERSGRSRVEVVGI